MCVCGRRVEAELGGKCASKRKNLITITIVAPKRSPRVLRDLQRAGVLVWVRHHRSGLPCLLHERLIDPSGCDMSQSIASASRPSISPLTPAFRLARFDAFSPNPISLSIDANGSCAAVQSAAEKGEEEAAPLLPPPSLHAVAADLADRLREARDARGGCCCGWLVASSRLASAA